MDIKLQMINLCVESSWKRPVVEFFHEVGLLQFRLVRWIFNIHVETLAKKVKNFAETKLKQDAFETYKNNFAELLIKDWKVFEGGKWVSFAFPEKNNAELKPKKKRSSKKLGKGTISKSIPQTLADASKTKPDSATLISQKIESENSLSNKHENPSVIGNQNSKIIQNDPADGLVPSIPRIETEAEKPILHTEPRIILNELSNVTPAAIKPLNPALSETIPAPVTNILTTDVLSSKHETKAPLKAHEKPKRPVFPAHLRPVETMPEHPVFLEEPPSVQPKPKRPVFPAHLHPVDTMPEHPIFFDDLLTVQEKPKRPVFPAHLHAVETMPEHPIFLDDLLTVQEKPKRPVFPAHLHRAETMPEHLVFLNNPVSEEGAAQPKETIHSGSEKHPPLNEPERITDIFSRLFGWNKGSRSEKLEKIKVNTEVLTSALQALDKALPKESVTIHSWPRVVTETEIFVKKIHSELNFIETVHLIKELHPDIFRNYRQLLHQLQIHLSDSKFEEIGHEYFKSIKHHGFHKYCNEFYAVIAKLDNQLEIAIFLSQIVNLKTSIENAVKNLNEKIQDQNYPKTFHLACNKYLVSYQRLLEDINEMVKLIPLLSNFNNFKISENEKKKLTLNFEELLNTEKNYLMVLKILVEFKEYFFKVPSDLNNEDDQKFLQKYFHDIENMHKLSEELIRDIEDTGFDQPANLLKIFLSKNFFDVYSQITAYERAFKIIKNSKTFVKHFNYFKQQLKESNKKELDAHLNNLLKLNIDDFLINTVQRLPRYDLLFSQAHKILQADSYPSNQSEDHVSMALVFKVMKNYFYNLGQVLEYQ